MTLIKQKVRLLLTQIYSNVIASVFCEAIWLDCFVAKPPRNDISKKEKRKMKNLKNEGLKILELKLRSFKAWRLLLALMLVLSFAAAPAQLALADAGGVKGHTFDVTFTKWISTWPNMVGVVGGAVREGTFAGEVLNYLPGVTITKIEALYHMNGSRHSFTAHVYVTQNNVTGMAAITGRVTEGWLEGAPVTGEYKVWASCPLTPPGSGTMCFQGTLHIQRGSEG
jgi:hypothetical protein